MNRRHDWPEQLAQFIDERRHAPFAWGTNDCALFAADAIERMTGVDLAKHLRGYKTERGALGKIRKVGGLRNFAQDLTDKHPGMAQRGDVVLANMEGRETFGVVVGGGVYAAPGPDGLVFRPMSEAVAAFGV